MNRPFKFTLIGFSIVLVVMLAACAPGSASSGANCQKGICVDMQLTEPIRFNQPVTATITVRTDQDKPKLSVALAADYGAVLEGTHAWSVDTKANQTLTFTGSVRFTREGYFTVIVGVLTTLGEYVDNDVVVYVTQAGGTANPTVLPGTPAPQPTLSPTESQKFTPPPLKNSILSSQSVGAWTYTTQDFEGTFPSTSWTVQDLSADGYDRYWGKSNYRAHGGSWAAWPARDGLNGIDPSLTNTHDYTNNLNTRMIYGPFDLSDAGLTDTDFYLWREIEPNYDYLTFEVSHDGVAFQPIVTWTGILTNWTYSAAIYDNFIGDNSIWVGWRFYSDNSITYDGPYVDDIHIWKYVPGQVTARGSFTYADRNGQSLPSRFMTVKLYDADPGGTDDLLAQTTTDANGYFEFPPIRNWDTDTTGQTPTTGRLDLYVVWEIDFNDSATARRRVTNFNDGTYQYYSAVQTDATDGTADFFNYTILPGDPKQGAMWIFQDLRRGWEYIQNNTGTDPGSATARWELNQNSLGICLNNSCFYPYWPQNGIFISNLNIRSSDAVVHEAGHQYMTNAVGWQGISCGPHNIFVRSSQLCAWDEGWSDFLPLAVNGDACYDFDIGPCGTGGFPFENLETHARGDGQPEGDDVEGRVAGALYDMYDTTNDGYDQISFGFTPLWTIVGDSSPEKTLFLFWTKWGIQGYNKNYAVRAIYQNAIDYDTTPTIADLPDRTVLQNLSFDNATDLWDYSSDPESLDNELTWSITGISGGGCSAMIDSHYIDLFALSGFLGSCDVTVRVSDFIKTNDDTFTMHVVPVAARAYLPIILKDSVTQALNSQTPPTTFVSPLPVPQQIQPFVSPLPTPSSQ